MYYVYLALAFIITNGQVVAVRDKGFRELGTGDVLGLPIPFILMIITYVVLHLVITRTTYGRNIRRSAATRRG